MYGRPVSGIKNALPWNALQGKPKRDLPAVIAVSKLVHVERMASGEIGLVLGRGYVSLELLLRRGVPLPDKAKPVILLASGILVNVRQDLNLGLSILMEESLVKMCVIARIFRPLLSPIVRRVSVKELAVMGRIPRRVFVTVGL